MPIRQLFKVNTLDENLTFKTKTKNSLWKDFFSVTIHFFANAKIKLNKIDFLYLL